MIKNFKGLLVSASVCLWAATASAAWPARVFAPYMYLGSGDKFELTKCDDACGQKFYTLAFIIADKEGSPAWDGRTGMDKNLYTNQIAAIRSRGGDVIVSFGGEAGKELALVDTDVKSLQAKYQGVIDQYQFTWLDFDIEGKALNDAAANERRNAALAGLQAANPGLVISYTLPVDPEGIPGGAKKMLADAKAKGVKVHSANVMTMDYGAKFSQGKKMSDVSIASAIKAHEQCAAVDQAIQIGLTAMTGQNDEGGEVFTLEDATAFEAWAAAQPWVCSVSFWSINRDAGAKPSKKGSNTNSGIEQEPWAFAKIFQKFAKP